MRDLLLNTFYFKSHEIKYIYIFLINQEKYIIYETKEKKIKKKWNLLIRKKNEEDKQR
jgi:hypothetical protein